MAWLRPKGAPQPETHALHALTDGTLMYVWGQGLAHPTSPAGIVLGVYHADGLGSVRALTNTSGSVTETYQTDEFGMPYLTQGTSAQVFRFTGEQREGE